MTAVLSPKCLNFAPWQSLRKRLRCVLKTKVEWSLHFYLTQLAENTAGKQQNTRSCTHIRHVINGLLLFLLSLLLLLLFRLLLLLFFLISIVAVFLVVVVTIFHYLHLCHHHYLYSHINKNFPHHLYCRVYHHHKVHEVLYAVHLLCCCQYKYYWPYHATS